MKARLLGFGVAAASAVVAAAIYFALGLGVMTTVHHGVTSLEHYAIAANETL